MRKETKKSLSIKHQMELRIKKAVPLRSIRPEMLMVEDHREKIDKSFLGDQIKKALKILNPRERKILELRFGLGDKEPKTLVEVGQEFGITGERVRTIEAKALKNLRKKIKNFF